MIRRDIATIWCPSFPQASAWDDIKVAIEDASNSPSTPRIRPSTKIAPSQPSGYLLSVALGFENHNPSRRETSPRISLNPATAG